MAAQAQPRTARISEWQWAFHKDAILNYYLDDNLDLVSLSQKMKDEEGFIATLVDRFVSQYLLCSRIAN